MPRSLCAVLLSTVATAPVARADSLRISVFGDSVLLGAADAIQSTLAGNVVTIDARQDLSLLGALGTLQAARPTIGDVVVLDLGYNDGTDLGVWRSRVDQAMAILEGVPRVIWLDQSNFASGRAEMDAELAAATQRYPNLDVAGWGAVVAAHPDFVYADGVHLTPAGQVAMADLVRQRVDAFVAARTAATSTTAAPTTTVAPTTTTTPPSAPGGDGGHASAAASGGGDSGVGDEVWIAAAIAGGLVVIVATVLLARHRRQRPAI